MPHSIPRTPVVFLAAALAACAAPESSGPAEPPGDAPAPAGFVDVTGDAGLDFVHVHGGSGERYMVETMGAGGGFLDFDNDGRLDVYLVQSGSLPGGRPPGFPEAAPPGNRLFRNVTAAGGSIRFEDVTGTVGGGDAGYGMGACFGDVDNDGFLDLYVTNFGPDRLLSNDGGRRLLDVTEAAGVDNPGWAASCAFADYDRDGCLDLYVTNYVDFEIANHRRCHEDGLHVYCHPDVYRGIPDILYHNRCDGTASFEDATVAAGVRNDDPRESKGLGVVWTDFDDDGDVDLYVANDSTRNFLYRNEGPGAGGAVRFTDVGVSSGTAFNAQGVTEAGMGVDAGDVDGDGRFDLFVAHLDFETNTLYRNQGGASSSTPPPGPASPRRRCGGWASASTSSTPTTTATSISSSPTATSSTTSPSTSRACLTASPTSSSSTPATGGSRPPQRPLRTSPAPGSAGPRRPATSTMTATSTS